MFRIKEYFKVISNKSSDRRVREAFPVGEFVCMFVDLKHAETIGVKNSKNNEINFFKGEEIYNLTQGSVKLEDC